MSEAFTLSQQAAIAARGNVLVVAGAGTGKTSTLVQRCMALLENGSSLENILMVTFTEAAAVEMRGRIRAALETKRAALHSAETESAHAVGQSIEHFQKQIALLDSALISTLHGFCMQLVREHFYELGIDPDVAVLDEQQTRPLIQQILDQMFERHYTGSARLDHATQRLVRSQGRGSDEPIRALILRLHRYSQSLAAPDQWIRDQRALFENETPDRWRDWLVSGFTEWRELWRPALMRFEANAAVAAVLKAFERVTATPSLAQIAEALSLIQAADADEKNWPRGSKKHVRDHLKEFFSEAEFLVSLTPREGVDPLLEDWELVRHDLLALLELTREFGLEFSRVKRELGGVDFADLEQFALRVLRDAEKGVLTSAARAWQERLEHVFVDEYQDINAAQDAILSALSRDGKKANRFLVGDVKQSIYRFRLADPTIFRAYEKSWSKSASEPGERGNVISLTENFRSRAGILDFINPLFAALMRDGIGGVAYEALNFGNPSGRSELAVKEGDAPRVELHLIAKTDSENGAPEGDNAEPSEVADLLATEREARLAGIRLRELMNAGHEIWDKSATSFRPVRWSDMAVLLRSPTSRVEAFAKEFATLGIPLEAARGGFFDAPEISDLISLLKLLDNPLQDVPLLAVLHSPLVGMSLTELAEIRANEGSSRAKYFWFAAQQFWKSRPAMAEFPGEAAAFEKPVASQSTAHSAWQKLNRFFQQLQGWRELVRQSSLSYCLETALVETHYEIQLRAQPRGEQQFANVRRLLDLARDYDPYQRQGLFRFLRFIRAQEEAPDDLEPAAISRDAVRLTSIHRSKGLEFPVVVVSGLGWQFNVRDLHEGILLDEQYGLCARIAPPESDQRYPSLPHWLARRRQHRELLGEELRLLYVAMTRARDTLVLTATSSRKGGGAWETAEACPLSDQQVLSARNYFDWLKLWLPQITRAEDWINERAGSSRLLSWNIYDENDPRLILPETIKGDSANPTTPVLSEAEWLQARARIAWKYPLAAATHQRAKTSVTELRRDQVDEEAAMASFVSRHAFTISKGARQKLNAAEIGVAHHRFLQRVNLSEVSSETGLRAEARRMQQAGWISAEEAAVLNFTSLGAFWNTDLGKRIATNASAVQRELQFTARLTADDLATLRLESGIALPDGEFVVIQGVVDLAVILAEEIWIVDFKTDAITELEAAGKVKSYEPQLKLYSLALEKIYGKRVTECGLYFLATQMLNPIERLR